MNNKRFSGKVSIRILSLFLALLLCSTLIFPTCAAEKPGKTEYTYFTPVNNRTLSSYRALTVRINQTTLPMAGRLIASTSYLPLRAVANAIGASFSYISGSRTATVKYGSTVITAKDGDYYVTVNDRPVLSQTPVVILSDGRMYLPARSLAKTLGLSVTWKAPSTVLLDGKITPMLSAERYYPEGAVFWLSRIISAESRGESLLGQIAVGTVVMNRVASRDYPNTIYGVIFDKKYGVQFSPILDGSIYAVPTSSAILAAKICLEGSPLRSDLLFFLAPLKASSSWIPRSRTYLFTIGNHDFYA